MLFSSITFLYGFLPIVLVIYLLCPKKFRNGVLLLASLVFYFFGEPIYTVLLLFSSLSDWLHSLYIESHRGKKSAKIALISSICINLGLLGFFKYADFFLATVGSLTGLEMPVLNLRLPIGISFYTFQTMSYTIDVYRGNAKAEKNLATLATFVCLFPQLIAGPIVRYVDVAAELSERDTKAEDLAIGIRRFAVGLGKKVLIANLAGELCAIFRASGEKSVLFYWIYAVAFTLQIYFDFSGYSDMAIGLGRMFGFRFPENFNYPYISRTVTEFWRRWHMTLGSFFRDYVYIPLGGNRTTKIKWLRNILVVWLLTGLWHGAAWNFVLWGGMFGVLLLAEKFLWGKFMQNSRVISHIYVMFLIVISFVIFNANGMAGAWSDLKGMFGFAGVPLVTKESIYYLKSYAVLLIVAAFGSLPFVKLGYEKVKNSRVMIVLEPVGVALILIATTACLVDGSFNPFLYFRF